MKVSISSRINLNDLRETKTVKSISFFGFCLKFKSFADSEKSKSERTLLTPNAEFYFGDEM